MVAPWGWEGVTTGGNGIWKPGRVNSAVRFDLSLGVVDIEGKWITEQTIAEIECLERTFMVPEHPD
jgi:hypothetical protein